MPTTIVDKTSASFSQANAFTNEVFHVYRVEYPRGGLSNIERQHLMTLLNELKAAAGPATTAAEFALPTLISPEVWQEKMRKNCFGWRWKSGMAFRLERQPEPKKPSLYHRYLKSLKRSFPEQIGQVEQLIKSSEGPSSDLAQYLTKTPGFEQLFRGRVWVSPSEALLGTGGFAMFCVEDLDRFFREASAAAGQQDNPFVTGSAFVIPLLTQKSFAGASREDMRGWFRLFHVYALEYGYAEGLLIASRQDVSPIIQAFHAALNQESSAAT